MQSALKKTFRIEKTYSQDEGAESGGGTDHILAEVRHREMLTAVSELKKLITTNPVSVLPTENAEPEVVQSTAETISSAEDAAKEAKEIAVGALQKELWEMYKAIEQTKREILSLHAQAANGQDIKRVSEELDAIVTGTEQATETILSSAEDIDNNAAQLVAAIKDESMNNCAADIQDQVIKIFEACNFQDLTGQRISKVVSAFRYVDDRIEKMLEIWGGVESFEEIELAKREDLREDADLLNGPALEEDVNVASQDDIDALFD